MIDAVVTGGSGFLGSRLVARLQNAGMQVLALSSRNGDIASAGVWEDLPAARTLFHLAGRSYVPDSWEHSADFMHANVIGTERALAYCRRNGANMVLASAYLYGIPRTLPVNEQEIPKPNNPYALSKWMAEEVAAFSCAHHHMSVTALRIFNAYGLGQRDEFLIPSIVRQVRQEQEIRVRDLTPKRDYVHIEDVVSAMVLAGRAKAGFQRLNIGSGVSISVADIVDVIQKIAGTKLPVVSENAARQNEIWDVRADIGAARAALGWQPDLSFEDGIQEFFPESMPRRLPLAQGPRR